jgi:hypothetical protein
VLKVITLNSEALEFRVRIKKNNTIEVFTLKLYDIDSKRPRLNNCLIKEVVDYMSKVILSFIFLTTLAYGQWSPKARKIIEDEAVKYKSFDDAGYVSYWGGIRRRFADRENTGEIKEFKLPGLTELGLKTYFRENKQSAKLHVFFPGVFGSLDSEITKRMTQIFESIGGNVLVIPNFLAVDYIQSKPIYGKRSLVTDILIPLKIIDKYNKNVNEIHLYAESLGSYIGASVLARLSNRSEMKNKKLSLTLLWPPIEIKSAISSFDKNIEKSKSIYNDCSLIVNGIKTIYYFMKDFYPKEIDRDYITCMSSMFYHAAFVKSIKKSYEETSKFDKNIEIENFSDYLKQSRPGLHTLLDNNEKDATLKYWLNKRNVKNTRVQIVTSVDDFLNIDKDWKQFLKETGLSDESFILMKWGGHSGPLGMPIWADALKANL